MDDIARVFNHSVWMIFSSKYSKKGCHVLVNILVWTCETFKVGVTVICNTIDGKVGNVRGGILNKASHKPCSLSLLQELRVSDLFKLRIYNQEWNFSSRKVNVYEKIEKTKQKNNNYEIKFVMKVLELESCPQLWDGKKKMCFFFFPRVSIPGKFWKQWLQAYR